MILEYWRAFSKWPLGKSLFNLFFWRYVPYTGSIRPEVLELSPGKARVRIKDRRCIRNHLNSVHAAALMNVSEAASGLAFVCGLPKDARAIVTDFRVEYKKKARGSLIAECDCNPPTTSEKRECRIEAFVKDSAGDIVAIGHATWLVSPMKK